MESGERVRWLLGECVRNGSLRGLPGWMWKLNGVADAEFSNEFLPKCGK